LLELLISQMKVNEKIQMQLEEAQTDLKDADKKLADRKICIMNAGSIAEAALVLNNVFEAAEAASAQYVENIRLLNERQQEICEKTEKERKEKATSFLADIEKQCMEQKESTEEYCRKLKIDTEEKCRKLTEETEQKCLELETDTAEKCMNMEKEAQVKIQSYWNEVSSRLESFYAEHTGLRELLSVLGQK